MPYYTLLRIITDDYKLLGEYYGAIEEFRNNRIH